MNTSRAAVVLRLVEALHDNGSWCGATHVQKTAYFLQELLGVDLEMDPDFILYKHGPYSFGLQDSITEMLGYGMLDLRLNPLPYGPSLVLAERGERLISQEAANLASDEPAVEYVGMRLGEKGVVQLERLGTALFVTLEDEDLSLGQRADAVHELKPHISVSQALQALREVDEMREEVRTL